MTNPPYSSKDITQNVYEDPAKAIRTTLINSENGENITVQYPLSTDGDSVYCKDIWIDESITTDWIDENDTGLDIACIPFTNLHTIIKNITTDNPKILRIHFNRTIFATQIGLGCVGIGSDFSNVCIKALGSGGVERIVKDESTNDTKYTSRNYFFSKQELFNAIQIEFNTVDEICISNITIQKIREVSVGQVERTTNSLKTIEYSHAELHSGTHYYSRGNSVIGNNESFDLLVVTPDTTRWAHMIFSGSGETGEVTISLYENTITSSDGIKDNERNRNRNFLDNNTTFVYTNPVITSIGDNLGSNIFGANKSFGGGTRDSEEILLRQNTKYLFRITNNTVSNNTINWHLDWYEHVNINEP